MFERSTLVKAPRRLWATCAGFGLEAVLLTSLVLVPLIWPQAIPRVVYLTALAPPGPPPAPPPRGSAVHPQHRSASLRTFRSAAITAPAAVPVHAVTIVDPPPEAGDFGVPGGIAGGAENGIPGGVIGSVLADVRPPVVERPPEPVRAPEPAAPTAIPRLVIGGNVKFAEPLFRPEPAYPPLARSMRISGVVELVAVIGTDGRIKELHLKSGHPLLARAAMEAVARWIYKPTLLDGVPVEVLAPITVTFHMN
ncbi:MAG TPA: energy transducer TonB [Bryobacteraceae bacterium]|nr:energy transducer TonB [Bryobacteraceae bacterium]